MNRTRICVLTAGRVPPTIVRMRRRHALAATACTAVALVACGSGDDDPASSDAAAPVITADGNGNGGADGEPDATASQGSGAAPRSDRPDSVRDGFPVPFPGGWEIDIQGEIGMTNTSGAQLLYRSDAFEAIVAFYDEWFESQPDEFARSVTGEQVLFQSLGETVYVVTITGGHEERERAWTLLQVFGGE